MNLKRSTINQKVDVIELITFRINGVYILCTHVEVCPHIYNCYIGHDIKLWFLRRHGLYCFNICEYICLSKNVKLFINKDKSKYDVGSISAWIIMSQVFFNILHIAKAHDQ